MTSNTTRPTKTKAGGPNYHGLYKNLQEEHIALKSRDLEMSLYNAQLQIEASRSIDNLQERNYYRKSARLWCACSVLLAASWVIFAVTL